MKINSIVHPNLLTKLILGAIISVAAGVTLQYRAVASTLTFQKDNSYGLVVIDDFGFSLNRSLSSQLEQELLPQNSDLSEYINLVTQKTNDSQDLFLTKINILSGTSTAQEPLFNSLLGSLRNLEFQNYSNEPDYSSSIVVLSQVNYQDIYQDVYDFDITLTESSPRARGQVAAPQISSPESLILSSLDRNYSQNSRNYNNYSSLNSLPRETTDSNYSLLASPPQNMGLSSLLRSPLSNSSLTPNSNISSFVGSDTVDTSSLINRSSSITKSLNSQQDYSEISNLNSRLKDIGATISIPSSEIKAYKLEDFKNVRSKLDGYQKPEYQQNIETILESQKQEVKKQREQMYEKIKKLQEQRRVALEKKQQQYKKKRDQELQKTLQEQRKLQEQRQAQYSK